MNEIPTSLSLSSTEVQEGQLEGTLVGYFSTKDRGSGRARLRQLAYLQPGERRTSALMFDLIGRGYAMPGERNDAPRGPALAAGREEVSALDRALAIDGMGLPHGHAQSGIRQLRVQIPIKRNALCVP